MTAAASASAAINHHTQVGGELLPLAGAAAAVVLVGAGLAVVSVGVGDSSAASEVGEGAAFAADVELATVVFAVDELTTGGRVVADVAGGGTVDVATAGVVVCGEGSDDDRVIVGRFGAEVESSIDVAGALGVDGALDVPGRVGVGSAIERDGVPGTDSDAVGRSGRLELQDVTAAPVPTIAASTASNTGPRPNLATA